MQPAGESRNAGAACKGQARRFLHDLRVMSTRRNRNGQKSGQDNGEGMKSISYRKIASNMMISVMAQVIYLCVSLLVNLILPRFIPEEQFAHWQLYITYLSFVCILNFGVFDGLMLRYSKYDYDELEKKRVRSQFHFVLIVTTITAIIFILLAFLVLDDDSSRKLMVLIGIAIITKNVGLYTSDTFQLTNRIRRYAFQSISQRLTYGIIVICLICCGVENFFWYCFADICGDCMGIVFGLIFNRGMYFGREFISPSEMVRETGRNIRAGGVLMLAVWSCTLTITAAKLVVEWCWGLSYFSNVALAFSITNVFLSITTAVSNVLFPSMRRLKPEKLPSMYRQVRMFVSALIFLVFILYYPGCWIFEMWLPQYSTSLPYLGFLLPVVVFSVKRNLLANSYLKTYRKERMMFAINIFAGALGIIAFVIIGKIFRSINALLIAVDVAMMLSCILSEYMVTRVIKVNIIMDTLMDIIMSAGFICITYFLSRWWACLAYAGLLVVYFAINHRFVISTAKNFMKAFRRITHRAPKAEPAATATASAATEGAATETAATHGAATTTVTDPGEETAANTVSVNDHMQETVLDTVQEPAQETAHDTPDGETEKER